MMKKIIGFIICTLLIASAVYPVIGNANIVNHVNLEADQNPEISTNIKPVSIGRDNNNIWVNLSPKTIGGTLKPREYPAMAYNSSADKVIMFGGFGAGNLRDTWAYNFSTNTWMKMNARRDYSEVSGPLPGLQMHAMVYDSDADLTLMFGGMLSGGAFSNDTWSYDYATNIWTKMNALGSYGEVDGTLSPRVGMKMVYDSSVQRVIMFSGASSDGFFADTWVYNSSDNHWYNMSPATVGGTLNCTGFYGLAYDSVADRTIMSCGGQVVDAWTNETWVYNYNDNKWYKMNPEIVGGTLFGRWGTTMVYDSNADRTILFGGQKEGGSVQLNDTWVYNYTDTRWCKASFSEVGGTLWRREATDMVYDSTHKRIVLFGGFSNDIGTGEMLNDTWMFKYNIGNEPPNPPTNPVPINGSINVGIDADISWYCWDPDLDDLTYDVYFEADDPTPDVKVSSNQTETTYDPGTMEMETTYYWKIIAWDIEGHSTAGPIWHFTTKGDNPPYTPSDPNPEDGETGVNINTDLSWTGGDPDGDEVTYDVYFGTSTPPPLVESNQSGTTYDPGILEFETEYYWQIVAWDIMGNSAVGPIWSFITEEPNEPPTAPDIDGPSKGKPGKEICWTFHSEDPNDDDVKYIIDWGDESSEETDYYPSCTPAEVCHTYEEEGTYIIKAIAEDIKEARSDESTFEVEIPRSRASSYQWLLECFPLLEKLLTLIRAG